MGKIHFQTQPDRSRLVRVKSEAQSQAMSNLLTPSSDPFCATPDNHLNTCTGTISISPQDCPIDDKTWSDCHTDLDLLSEYDAVNVRCYTLSPRGCQKNPTNLLMSFLLASAETVGTLATLRNTAALLFAVLCVALPTSAMNALLLPGAAAIVVVLIMLSTAAAQHISLRLRSLVFASVTVSRYVRPVRKPVA